MKRVLALVVVVVVATLTPASAAGARRAASCQLTLDRFEVGAVVNPDGSMDVSELLTFDMDDCNGGTRTIPPDTTPPTIYSIERFTVAEDGERRDLAPGFDDPNTGEVRWFGSGDHSKTFGVHTYELRYRVVNAVDVFPDVGVLNWKFVGDDFPGIGQVQVDVTMPGDGTDLRAFAHGVLHGVIALDTSHVNVRVVDNPAGEAVETRIVVPASVFTVAPSGPPQLDAILADEGVRADDANAQREAARRQFEQGFRNEVARGLPGDCGGASRELARRCQVLERVLTQAQPRVDQEFTPADGNLFLQLLDSRRAVDDEIERLTDERNKAIGNIVGPVVGLLGVGAFLVIWRKWGKEPDEPENIGEYFRDVPAESPAVVASLDDWGSVDSKAFAATVIDLAQRGWFTISEEGNDFRFSRSTKAEGEPLRNYENRVLWRLFEGGRATVTQDELTAEASSERTTSASWMSNFRQEVNADFKAQGYIATQGCLPWLLHAAVIVVLALVGVGATFGLGAPGGVVALVGAAVLVGLTPLLRKRTVRGTQKYAEINGLRKFLEDFSLVDDVPVGHLALYERYLVYAVALGVADKLLAGLRVRFPELAAQNSGFAPWYIGAYGYGHGGQGLQGSMDRLAGLNSLGSFANNFSSATAAAFSPPSSSSGSGGGFSGGSSGGGGGGGAGGW